MTSSTGERRPANTNSARVLIVDDDALIRSGFERAMSQHFSILTAASGEEALAIIDAEPGVDAIVSDMMMPGMTGVELHDQLLVRHPRLAALFIFVTGSATQPGVLLPLASTGATVLEKPIAPETLLAAVTNLLAGRPRERTTTGHRTVPSDL